MPQEMLAEDKHWSRWYLFTSYLIAHTLGKHAFTHTHTHTHIHTHKQTPFMIKCNFLWICAAAVAKRTQSC